MKDVLAGIAIASVLMIIVLVAPMAHNIQNLHDEAISNHFAEYNPTNGNWQWRTNK